MYKFIKYSVFTFTALFLLSCQNDELENKQENAKVAKTNLELAKFSNLNIAQNVEADFEKVNEIEKDNFKISEFSAKEKVVNTFESNVLQSQLKYQGVTIENEGKSQSYFLEVYTLAKSVAYPQTITKLKGFTGGLNVYSFNGENLGSVVVRNGEAKNISEKEDLDVLTKAINLFYVPSEITSKIPLCDATYTQTVWLTQDVWRIISNGPKILEVIYVGEKVTKSTNILPYPCDGSGDVEAIKLQRMAHYSHYSENGQYLGESSTLGLPPSCESFNFTSKKGANWQEAVVKNIYFRIIVLDNKGARVNHVVDFPQGVLFGMAINFNKGNVDVTPGVAATVSAIVLNKVMNDMDAKYARTEVSDLILRTEFQSRLIKEYREYTNGGTVNFNTGSSLPATNYKTNPSRTGKCDEN
ncbi:hypothetical protein [Flavobacterium chungangensis]|uniref:Uncharacterized protein n=1 Tax=Flavobacterium chungangensis TaxID=2708132 RepID=A0ABV8ZK25_9FLAO